MDNNDIINEVFGGKHPALTGKRSNPGTHLSNANNVLLQRGTGNDKPIGGNQPMPHIAPPEMLPKNWQHLITTRLVRGNSNLFVNVAPSAGKTYPIMMSYFELLRNAKPNRIPVIIWVAETKLLSSQIEQELREILYQALYKSLTSDLKKIAKNNKASIPKFMIAHKFSDVPGFAQHQGPIDQLQLPRNMQMRMKEMIDEWTGVQMAASAGASAPGKRAIAITCTYEFATKLIKQYKPAIVVIDEVQERFKPENTDPASEHKKVRHFFDNIVAADKSNGTSSVTLTGSMNPSTAGYIKKYMDHFLNHPIEMVSFGSALPGANPLHTSTGERNKARITVLPTDLVRNDIPKLVVDQIRGRSTNNLAMTFSKRKITEFVDDIIDSTNPRDIATVLKIKDDGDDITPNTMTSKYQSPSRQPQGEPVHTIGSVAKQGHGPMSNIELYQKYKAMVDPKLQEAIRHGFGYIMSGDDKDGQVPEGGRIYSADDIKVVEEMFKRGLISTVIATTSVGVGVNLKVRSIYIPSIDVYNQEFKNPRSMSNSSLAQLVHRAGRKVGEAAIIYCNKKDIQLITTIISSGDPSTRVEPIPYSDRALNKAPILDRFNYARSKRYRDLKIYELIFGKDKQ